jgi:ribosomal protein S18 acetylase RimI-like enzyme
MIRPITPQDLDSLLILCSEHADYEQLAFQVADQKSRWQALFFSDPSRIHVWVYEHDGDLQGYMSVTLDYATWSGRCFAYMDCLYLRPTYRGLGLGRQFISTLQAFASSADCDEIQWHTPTHNQLGIDFYRHIGAVEKAKLRYFLSVAGDPS